MWQQKTEEVSYNSPCCSAALIKTPTRKLNYFDAWLFSNKSQMLFRSFTSACSTILISLRSLKLSVSIQDGVLLKKTCKTSCWIAIFRMFLASILLIKNNIYANSIEKSTLRTTFLSIPLKPPYVPALHTAGKELIFFIVSGMMLCFGFWRKTMLIAH